MLFREIIVDNFAGGGGASQGIFDATGMHVDIAINHDQDAIAMHEINHPETQHFCESVWDINPREVVKGRPVSLAWFSPDCKHFSKAKGSTPVNKNIRGLAWIALRWAATVKPRVIMLENVEEFKTWGPLLKDGKPCPDRKGNTFGSFIRALNRQGYEVEHKELRACDYGTPTIRKRLFLIARRDGKKIIWPKITHGDPKSKEVKKGLLLPWRTAAECIDWSIPCPSIFERKKPLAENTLRRIAKGLQRFVIDNPNPFIVKVNHGGDAFRGQSINDPVQTITSKNGYGLVTPFITEHANASNQRNMEANIPLRTVCAQPKGGHFAVVSPIITRQFGKSVGHPVDQPSATITTGGGGKSQLVSAFLAKHYTGVTGVELTKPVPTVTSIDHNALVTSNMIKLRGTNTGHKTDEPLHTITAGGNHLGEVRAFLLKYYGNEKDGVSLEDPLHTVTVQDRFGLVTVKGEQYQIIDIGMRMLQPSELFKAQGFPANYIIDVDKNGKKTTKSNQVARCGNSVCPPLAKALVQANLPELAIHNQEFNLVGDL